MPLTWKQLIEKAKSEICEISTEELARRLSEDGSIIVIDVREHDEFALGHIPNALFLPRGFLELRIDTSVPDHSRPICLYCGGGNRSALAARSLQEMGYENVYSLEGGLRRWIREERPVEEPREPDIDPQLS